MSRLDPGRPIQSPSEDMEPQREDNLETSTEQSSWSKPLLGVEEEEKMNEYDGMDQQQLLSASSVMKTMENIT